jgi:hypothetical protein
MNEPKETDYQRGYREGISGWGPMFTIALAAGVLIGWVLKGKFG